MLIVLCRLIHGKPVTDHVLPTVLKLLRHRDEGPVPLDDWCDVLIAAMPVVSAGTITFNLLIYLTTQ